MTARACQHHPEEAAVGICVRCSTALCDACITKVDGINHCRSCLLSRAELPAPVSKDERAPNTSASWLVFTLGLALLAALAFSTLNAVLPVGAP